MNKKILAIGIIILLIIPALSIPCNANATLLTEENSIQKNSVQSQVADWTVMCYFAGESLGPLGVDKFLHIAEVGSTDEVNIIVQLDRPPEEHDDRYGGWTTTKRYRVTQGMVPDNESALMDIGEANMADPQTLIDFVTWATDNYPADQYCLILFDHGGGWYGICIDTNKSEGDDILKMPELKSALSTITNNGENPIDLILFDACIMAMLEVAYEIAPYALFMTASEITISSDVNYSIQYDETFTCLTENPTMSPEALGATFVSNFTDYTLSTLDLGLVNNLKDAVSDLGTSLQVEEYFDEILNVINEVEYCFYNGADLYHLAQLLQNYIDDFEIDAKAQTVMDQINNTVISEKHIPSVENVHGITIYLVARNQYYWIYNPEYSDIAYAHDSQWDEFLLWYLGMINTNPPEIPDIIGPTSGQKGILYNYTFKTKDPDSDYVYFYIDWGDGTNSGWIGPFGLPWPSHLPYEVTLNHTWTKKGNYQIKVKAKDIFDLESDWGTLEITIPRNKAVNSPFLRFLEQFPNAFPILRQLLGL